MQCITDRLIVSHLLKAAALLIAALWVAAIALPARQVTYGYSPYRPIMPVDGWQLLAFGWLGPLGLSFAWYANPMLVIIVIGLGNGRKPSPRLVFTALALAASVFLPTFIPNLTVSSAFSTIFTVGPAVWTWLGAFTVAACTLLLRSPTKGYAGKEDKLVEKKMSRTRCPNDQAD